MMKDAGRASRMAAGLWLAVVLGVAGCARPQVAVAPPPPPREALAFDDAVDGLAIALLGRAQVDLAEGGGRVLVIDPLIDRATGNQAAATRSMERRIGAVVRTRFDRVKVAPFTTDSLEDRPLVLVGSITPVPGPGIIPATTQPTETYRIWAAIADLRTNRIVSHETAWVRADGVDMTPTPFFRDSPAWLADRSQASYIRTCAGDPGDAVDPVYLAGLFTAAVVNEGITAYEDGRYEEALALYRRAQVGPGGDQPRVYNGIYLTNAALGREAAAEAAFGTLVSNGLQRGKLAVKFVFRPASTQFWPDRAVSGPYPMWLRQIAGSAVTQSACLRLVGHTSPTGPALANQRLSEARADRVRDALVDRAPRLAGQMEIEGRGSAEPMVGSGRDDVTDALDRRVEFETRPCLRAGLAGAGVG
ncbi:MAG: OmpA family protein [Gemmatimonadaceae bacterium]|nr:OmpA family protein [Acetobacteraceae bacterium]